MGNANDIMSDAIIEKEKNLSISGIVFKRLSQKNHEIYQFALLHPECRGAVWKRQWPLFAHC